MFEDRQAITPTPDRPAVPKPDTAHSDIVIHTLPKEFYDREVKLEPAKVVALPKPVAQPPVQPPKALSPAVPKRSKLGVVIVVLLGIILLIIAAGAFAYSQGLFKTSEVLDTTSEVVVEPEPQVPVPEPEPAKPVSGVDTDSDGLTNVEELLYGTDFRNPDSDGDTYLDGNEVFHRFDPRGLAPSTLLDTGAVRVLESLDLPFTMFYPTTWNPTSTPASQRVSFRSTTGAAVNVLWQDKTTEQALGDWYTEQVGEVALNRLQPTLTKEGYQAVIGPDERVMYLEAGTRVYTLIYDLVEAQNIEFLQTFKMMANSFKLVP